MKRMSGVLLSLAAFLSSCSLLDSGEGALRLETDREAYELDTAEEIEVEAKNTSSSVIYYNTCMPTTLEALGGGRTVATLGFPVCECLCRAELGPGERWRYSVPVDWIEEHKDQLRLGEDHTYRLRLEFFEDREMREPLDSEALYTNRFDLTE